MFLTRSFLPPPPFALPIVGHANSFRPVFFWGSSVCASVDLKGRLKIIKLAAFNVCCHQQEQRFGFKDGWRRGGKHQRAKMWVSVKVFSNELQWCHTVSDTDRHARNKHWQQWSDQRRCEADETVISSEGCSLSPAAGWTGNYTVRSQQAGSADGSENREGETRRKLSLVKQKIFGALRCSEKSLLCVTEICFPLVIGRSSQQQGVFCRWTRWTLVLWRSELSGLISCRGLYSSVWPCCHFIPFLFTGGFKYGVAVFAEVNRLKYSNTPLFEYLNGTETDTVQFCESVALWECWCKITVVTASHVLVSALIFSLSSSVSPVCLFVADIR